MYNQSSFLGDIMMFRMSTGIRHEQNNPGQNNQSLV